jgi:2-phospho-L-lactate transferase/gluconeogenesis factor (CofD/UPF0052 family)
MKAVVFSGGRGCTNIIKSIISQTDLDLSIVVNAYDNGKSTGRIRSYVPGLLGPSDIRKNVSILLECYNSLSIANFLEFRLKSNLRNLPLIDFFQESNSEVFSLLSFEQYQNIKLALDYFEKYQKKVGNNFETFDCAIGNILLSSLYLQYENDFNYAVDKYQEIFLPKSLIKNRRARVLNVTDGENLYLIARSNSGKIFMDESEIVVNQNKEIIREIALVSDLKNESIQSAFKNIRMPKANPMVLQFLKTMDLLIYGPGTQASSLLPSYLTSDVLTEISRNSSAKKIFISNLVPDFDDPVSNVISRLETFFVLANLITSKNIQTELVTNVFSELEISEISNRSFEKNFPGIIFQTDNWLIENNKHLGAAIVRQLSQACDRKLKFKPGLISVIVYDYYLENSYETYSDLLKSLLLNINLDCEIIIVTRHNPIQDVREKQKFIGEQKLSTNKIRFIGSIHESLLESRGDVVAYFGNIELYELSDLVRGIRLLVDNDKCHFVLGSRNLRIFDLKKQIREAYPTQPIRGFISYWGSLVISISFLLRFRRFITDPLSGVKIFKKIDLSGKELEKISKDIDINLIKFFIRAELPIQQFEIDFNSNSLSGNNRHKLINGIKSLINIWKLY